MKRPRVGGDEQDAFSRYCRRRQQYRPGMLRWIKRKANKRERRDAKGDTQNHDHPLNSPTP